MHALVQVVYPYRPYFLLRVKEGTEAEVEQYLRRKFENRIASVEVIEKEDLDLKNHLVGKTQP